MSTKKVASKSPDGKKAKKAHSSREQGTPDTKDVIALATSLVSAQIMAGSYHDTAMELLRGFRQIASEAISSINEFRSDTSGKADPNLQADADLKRRLDRIRLSRTRLLEPMSHPDLDRLFQSATRRAFVMLNAPFDPDRVVFAEQIFRPEETLPEGAIRARFIEFEWPGLKSGGSVGRLMADVNAWFLKHRASLDSASKHESKIESSAATDPEMSIQARIKSEVGKLTWLLNQTAESGVSSSYRDLSSALSAFTSRHGLDFGGTFQTLDDSERSNLIRMMFGGQSPRNISTDHEPKSPTEASSPQYRPWAIFRYIRLHGGKSGDVQGKSLNKRLRSKRSVLAQDQIPDILGIEPASFCFGPLHEEIDELLSRLEDEGSYSECAKSSDELECHELGPVDLDEDSEPDIPHF